jgi:hypothetical protein
VILCGGLVLGSLLGVNPGGLGNGGGGGAPTGILVIEGALAIIALGAAFTIVQRVLHVRAQASREVSERPS